jgi:hypothetical protein
MSNSTTLYPIVIDEFGNPVDPRDEDYVEGNQPGQSNAYSTTGLPPLGWNRGRPDGSRMVGWTVHHRGSNRILEQHAFSINPQSIIRAPLNRNQMFATQGGFYVDDFGEGSETITISQLVAHGRASAGGGGSLQRATMRDDVIRFYDLIYTKVSANPGQYDLYFHDNHFWPKLDARVPEKVYFPSQGFQITRSVSLHNVWQMQVVMGTLQPSPNAVKDGLPTPNRPKIKVHIVMRGETLTKIAAKLAGKHATHKRILALQQQIVALTKKYGQDDITKNRAVNLYNPARPDLVTNTIHVTRMHLAAGEKIILPAG